MDFLEVNLIIFLDPLNSLFVNSEIVNFLTDKIACLDNLAPSKHECGVILHTKEITSGFLFYQNWFPLIMIPPFLH